MQEPEDLIKTLEEAVWESEYTGSCVEVDAGVDYRDVLRAFAEFVNEWRWTVDGDGDGILVRGWNPYDDPEGSSWRLFVRCSC